MRQYRKGRSGSVEARGADAGCVVRGAGVNNQGILPVQRDGLIAKQLAQVENGYILAFALLLRIRSHVVGSSCVWDAGVPLRHSACSTELRSARQCDVPGR